MIEHQDRHLSMPLQGHHLRKTPQGQHCLSKVHRHILHHHHFMRLHHSSVTVASMVTPSAGGKEAETAAGKKGSCTGKGASKEEGKGEENQGGSY